MTDHLRVEASAPASSANLGPGFDCLALALELRCRVTAEPAEVWTIDHSGEQRPDADADDAVLLAAERAVGGDLPLRLCVHNDIPIGRGLGSSSAAFAAGALAAWRVSGVEPEPRRLFELVAELEGHPDNAAAAVYGGLVLTPGNTVLRLPWNPIWRAVLAVPAESLRTSDARRILPPAYSSDVVIRSVSRMGSLVAGLLAGDAALLAAAGGDELHEEPRRLVRPDVAELIATARRAGAAHAAWSGAGPSVIALAEADTMEKVAAALRRQMREGGSVITPEVATRGAV